MAQEGCSGCPKSQPSIDPAASNTSSVASCEVGGRLCIAPCSGTCFFDAEYETCDYSDPSQVCGFNGTLYTDVVAVAAGARPAVAVLGGIAAHNPGPDNEFVNMPGVWGTTNTAPNQPLAAITAANGLPMMLGLTLSLQSGVLLLGNWTTSIYLRGPITWVPFPILSR